MKIYCLNDANHVLIFFPENAFCDININEIKVSSLHLYFQRSGFFCQEQLDSKFMALCPRHFSVKFMFIKKK